MNFSIAAFLGVLQGVTEFFPVSSSGHLMLAEHFLNLPVADLKAFDVVLHAGTLLALIVLFWREWRGMVLGSWFAVLGSAGRNERTSLRLLGMLVVATIPAAVAGLLLNDWIDEFTRGEGRVYLVAGFFVLVAGLLAVAEIFRKDRTPSDPAPGARQAVGEMVTWKQVAWMGIFQVTALLPGVSRSGATIAAGMFGGLTRSVAARFSFLMLAPVTLGAVILISQKVLAGGLTLPAGPLTLVGFTTSAIASYVCAAALLKFVKKHSLIVFSIYLSMAALALISYMN
ncbi:MAG: undecaprenyl-diphosphate phosphatase [Patescibacteria group bacterium]